MCFDDTVQLFKQLFEKFKQMTHVFRLFGFMWKEIKLMKTSTFAKHSHSTNIIWKSPFQKISHLYS